MSKKLRARFEHLKHIGRFTESKTGMRLCTATIGSVQEGNAITFFLMVDEQDGVIADSAFKAFGHPILICAADVLCELILRKNHEQARRFTASHVDTHLDVLQEERALFYMHLALDALKKATDQCLDIPLLDIPIASSEIDPRFATLTVAEKIKQIEEVIANDIRPYIENDAGGIQVMNLLGNEVVISYSGACTTCHSSTGATLSAIQNILQSKIHPDLFVTPV